MENKKDYLNYFLSIIDARILELTILINNYPSKKRQLTLLVVDNERWRVAVKYRLDKLMNSI
jgi:hypothetical protein